MNKYGKNVRDNPWASIDNLCKRISNDIDSTEPRHKWLIRMEFMIIRQALEKGLYVDLNNLITLKTSLENMDVKHVNNALSQIMMAQGLDYKRYEKSLLQVTSDLETAINHRIKSLICRGDSDTP